MHTDGDPSDVLAEPVAQLTAMAGLLAQSEAQLAMATRAADAGITAAARPAARQRSDA
jgi:hypothetical protein